VDEMPGDVRRCLLAGSIPDAGPVERTEQGETEQWQAGPPPLLSYLKTSAVSLFVSYDYSIVPLFS
jgi:hypothetical protein